MFRRLIAPIRRGLLLALVPALAGCGAVRASDLSSGAVSTLPAIATSGRQPTIIFRPAGLSLSKPVPLLVVLEGAVSIPPNMVSLTQMNTLAKRDGFVVAYLATIDPAHAWSPRSSDFQYAKSEIAQLRHRENIDPARIYVTGFSAGGYEAWRLGCEDSTEIAGVAIVANAMNQALYSRCHPTRPVSEFLIIGTADKLLFHGIPRRLPSAVQTTQRWRQIDGCASSPVRQLNQANFRVQLWPACTNSSAVALAIVNGAGHTWPGAPRIATVDPAAANYPASQQIWSFLSAHTLAPSIPQASIKSAKVIVTGHRRTLVVQLNLGHATRTAATLSRGGRSFHHSANLGSGSRSISVSIPSSAPKGRYKLTLVFVDSYRRQAKDTTPLNVPAKH